MWLVVCESEGVGTVQCMLVTRFQKSPKPIMESDQSKLRERTTQRRLGRSETGQNGQKMTENSQSSFAFIRSISPEANRKFGRKSPNLTD